MFKTRNKTGYRIKTVLYPIKIETVSLFDSLRTFVPSICLALTLLCCFRYINPTLVSLAFSISKDALLFYTFTSMIIWLL